MGVNAGNSWENVKDVLFLTALHLKYLQMITWSYLRLENAQLAGAAVDPHSSKMLFNEGAYPCPTSQSGSHELASSAAF